MKKYLYILTVVCGAALFMTSCTTTDEGDLIDQTTGAGIETTTESGLEDGTQDIPEEIVVEPVYGGTLAVSCRNPETLNPLENGDYTVDQVLELMNESLFYLDESYKPVPNLVEDVEYFTDNNYLILTLKEDVYFHNGTLFTAQDVAFSIEQLQGAESTSMYKALVSDIARTSVVDDYHIKIYYDQGLALATYRLTFPIQSKDYFKSDEYDAFAPIGLGAYKFESFIAMEELELSVNNEYFKDRPYISYIDCKITRSDENEATAFDQKLIDITNPSKFDWLQFSEDNTQSLLEYTTNYLDFLGFNFNNELLANQDVRKAIALCIDRESIVNHYYLNHAVITDYLTHPSSFYNPDNQVYSYDIDQAMSILDGTSLTDTDGDGLYDALSDSVEANVEIKLLVNSENSIRMSVANEIKDSLNAIGLAVTIDSVTKDVFYEKLSAKDFDLVLSGWKLSSVPDFTQLFHSEYIEVGTNFISYNNEMMDLYLEEIYTAKTEEDLLANLQSFNDFYVEELPYFSLYFTNSTVVMNDTVYGELTPTTENNFLGVENIYVVK
jgi:peptide/nickel transport system substrate-binding protein